MYSVGHQFAQRQRHRLGARGAHHRHLLGRLVSADRFACYLDHQPVPNRVAYRVRRLAIGVCIEQMTAVAIADMDMDHRGARLKTSGSGGGQFLRADRQGMVVFFTPPPTIRRDSDCSWRIESWAGRVRHGYSPIVSVWRDM